jgi:hypothetical protein
MNKAIVCAAVLLGLMAMTCQAAEKKAAGAGRAAIVGDDVNGKASDGTAVCFRATDPVSVVKTEGTRSLIQFWTKARPNTNPAIWVENEYISGPAAFKPMHKWHGRPEYLVVLGDYSATYHFDRDATFTLEEQADGPSVTYHGRLYEDVHRHLIWARRDNAHTNFYFAYEYVNMFVLLNEEEHAIALPQAGATYGGVPDVNSFLDAGGCRRGF